MDEFAPRWWQPYGRSLTMDFQGFVTTERVSWLGPDASALTPLQGLVGIPGLVLIGEPGLGKSTELRTECRRLSEQAGNGPDRVHWVSLGTTTETATLSHQIFEAEPYQEWLEGDGHLHLFLDSLDEARLRIPRIADLLLEGLSGAPFGRLSLRITCRSANRHVGLERGLQERFRKDEFGIFELAPLTANDVQALASDRGLDGGSILTRIVQRGLQPLAMVPESLEFLLRVVEATGDLPETRKDAYEQGLRLLAREPDEDRREERRADLTPTERLALASRIAGALVLSGRSSVVVDDNGLPGPDQLILGELVGGVEQDQTSALQTDIDATYSNLKDVVESALFSSSRDGAYGFGQASYAEFLCARWIAGGSLAAEQLDQLLFMDALDRRRVVPQLNEVAAWLADQDRDFFEDLLARDPTVLLRADPLSLDESGRHRLVAALIAGVTSGEVDRWDRRMREKYPTFEHSRISGQLREVICDRERDSRARQVACDVAGACSLEELESDLTDIAVDEREDRDVRDAALSALREFAGSSIERRRLRPLALEPLADDPDDGLKGGALMALWPDDLDASEAFRSLTAPKRRNLLGQYKSFLWNELLDGLRDDDLVVALNWAASLPVQRSYVDARSEVRERLLIRVWPMIGGDDALLHAYAEVVLRLLGEYADLLSSETAEKHPDVFVARDLRRKLVSALARLLGEADVEPGVVVISRPPLLDVADTRWLADLLLERESAGDEVSGELAHLLETLVAMGGEDEPVLEARESNSLLRKLTAERYDPIRLGSEAAMKAKERYEFWLQRNERVTQEPLDIDIRGNVCAALARFEAGEWDGFWLATKWLEIDVERQKREFFVSDLKSLPGWRLIDSSDQERIRVAARGYLKRPPPDPDDWFDGSTINWPAWAGYRAMRLIHDEERNASEELPASLWGDWSPIVVHWPRNDGGEGGEGEFNDWAVAQSLAKAPTETVKWFCRALDKDLRKGGHPFSLHRFRTVWTPLLETEILRRAKNSRLEPEQRAELLGVLLRNGSEEARSHTRRLVTRGALNGSPGRREIAVRAAVLLAVAGGEDEWVRIWPLVLEDETFGRALIERLATRDLLDARQLSVRQMGDLFSWLLARYPYAEDRIHDGASYLDERDHVARYRDSLLGVITEGSTRESVVELGRLIAEHPELDFLREARCRAERRLQQAEWIPPNPQQVVRLSEEVARRYVRSAADLRLVVLESLKRAQARLSGLRSAVADLWDLGTVRPKRERSVGAWIERHLQDDLDGRGIIVGREVEVRAHPKSKMGEAVDLLVTAIAGKETVGASAVSVSVELKCCWNRDLDTALREQLLDIYLDEESNNQGIYLVAYFDSPLWDDGDARNRASCRRRSIDQTRTFFASQAASCSASEVADIDAFVLDCRLLE